IPALAQASIASRSVSRCSVAVLIESRATSAIDAVHREHLAHPARGEIGIPEKPRRVGEAEELGEVKERPGALLPAHHREMRLMAVEIGHEDDPGLVE